MVNSEIHTLSWIINNACNLACIHCYPDSGYEVKRKFTNNDFEVLEKNLSTYHFDKVFISGGEPLLDSQLFEYIEIAKKISDKVYICTNATNLDNKKLEEIKKLGIYGFVVSMQHLTDDLAKKIYVEDGIVSKIKQSLKLIQIYDFDIRLEITLLKINFKDIDRFFEFVSTNNISKIAFKRFRPIGRGKESEREIGLSKEENYEALTKIYRNSKLYENISISVNDPLYTKVVYENLINEGLSESEIDQFFKQNKLHGCKAGKSWIGVGVDGKVSPCPLLIYQDVIIGNIFDNDIKSIMQNSKMMKKLSEEVSCSCKFSNYCRGCRVAAIAYGKDLYGNDPMCIGLEQKSCFK